MRSKIKIISATIGGIVFLTLFSSLQAQEEIPTREMIKSNLTEEQKEILQANRSSMAETRAAFKASLTAQQIEMLKNNALTMEQKRANLKASMSAQQKQVLTENRQIRQIQKRAMMNSLTLQQKQMLKRAYLQRLGKPDVRPGLKRPPFRKPRWRR